MPQFDFYITLPKTYNPRHHGTVEELLRGCQVDIKDAKTGEIHLRDVPECSSPVLATLSLVIHREPGASDMSQLRNLQRVPHKAALLNFP